MGGDWRGHRASGLPSILSLPLVVAAVCGTWSLTFGACLADLPARWHALVVFGLVPLLAIFVIVAKLDHFPRHWVLLIPWAAIAAGWWLARLTDWFVRRGERVAAVQSLFKGTSDYHVAARFLDGYVMPEYQLVQRLIGDRARSYITEVVIFTRRGT